MIAEIARYGFTSPPGTRLSGRRELPCPMTRSAHVRLSSPHATPVGANVPFWYRLYELIVGAYSRVNSRRVARIPAIQCSMNGLKPYAPSPAITGRPSWSRTDKWIWQLLPSRSLNLAMKVRALPCFSAISFARPCRSCADRQSRAPRRNGRRSPADRGCTRPSRPRSTSRHRPCRGGCPGGAARAVGCEEVVNRRCSRWMRSGRDSPWPRRRGRCRRTR